MSFQSNQLRPGQELTWRASAVALVIRGAVITVLLTVSRVSAEERFEGPVPEVFEYPLAWLKTSTAKERMNFEGHRNRMVKLGWDPNSSKSLAKAESEFDAARKLGSEDPRLEYAYGLMLWNHGQFEQAINQFDAAAHLKDNRLPFLPAGQAAAWGRILTNQRQSGWNNLVTLASVVAKSNGDYPTSLQKEFSALSLGRAVGFLTGPGRREQTAAEDASRSDEVCNLIPAGLRSKFVAGREQIDNRHEQLRKLAALPAEALEGDFQKKRAEFEQVLNGSTAEIAHLKKMLSQTAKDHRKWLGEQQKKLDQCEQVVPGLQNGIVRANAQFEANYIPQRHYMAVQQSFLTPSSVQYVTNPNRDKDDKKHGYQLSYVTASAIQERPETPFEYQMRTQQCAAALQAGQTLNTQLKSTVEEYERLKEERSTTKKAHMARSAELRLHRSQELRAQRESQMRVMKAEKELNSLQTLKDQVNVIAPYVAWNVEAERDSLQKSYRVAPAKSAN